MTKLCSAEGCTRGLLAKGLCRLHYKRMQRNGNLTLMIAEKGSVKPLCPVTDCDREVKAGGYCIMHYKRQKRNGTTDRVLRQYSLGARCEHCGSFGRNGRLVKGFCHACYLRQFKKGYVERDIAPQGSGTLTKAGYRVITVDGKREYEHRHYMGARKGEVVHHKDGDPSNNDPDNLEILSSQSAHMKLHAAKREKHD